MNKSDRLEKVKADYLEDHGFCPKCGDNLRNPLNEYNHQGGVCRKSQLNIGGGRTVRPQEGK